MKRLRFVLPIMFCLAAPAVAQRFQFRVSPREDGGQTVSAGTASRQPQQPQQQAAPAPPVDVTREIDRVDRVVLDQIVSDGRLSPSLAADTLRRLADPALARAGASARPRVQYNRALSYAAAVSGDLATARAAADLWCRGDPVDAAAIRNQLMLALLAGDGKGAQAAITALSDARHARWLPWTTYMRNFVPQVGARPEVEFAAPNGTEFSLADHKGKVVVLCFEAVDDQVSRKLLEMYRGPSVVVRRVRLGPDSGPALDAAKALGVSAAPTAYVFGRDGRVLFAGDPRTWEVHVAIGYAQAAARTEASAAEPQPTPQAATSDREKQARELYDQGWDKTRLWAKTRSPMYRKEARELLEQVIRDYPETAAAGEAQMSLRDME